MTMSRKRRCNYSQDRSVGNHVILTNNRWYLRFPTYSFLPSPFLVASVCFKKNSSNYSKRLKDISKSFRNSSFSYITYVCNKIHFPIPLIFSSLDESPNVNNKPCVSSIQIPCLIIPCCIHCLIWIFLNAYEA